MEQNTRYTDGAMPPLTALSGAAVFDGKTLRNGLTVLIRDGRVSGIVPEEDTPADAVRQGLDGGMLLPGFVDLQVNGGGGLMLNTDPSVATLRIMARAHASLGTTAFLPTLITDTPAKTRAAIDAVAQAIAEGVAGIAGLHLEGPHLSIRRKGAHDPALIRPMEAEDLALLLAAAARLPAMMVTVAPENCTRAQVRAMRAAGIVVSLGHSDADFETCMAYADAGATVVTHLFNAMSQFEGRAPGLVGATLQNPAVSAGLIADTVHVHPASMALALRAKNGPGRIFLVSDAMAVAGTDLAGFSLEGRPIARANGRLTLADGTLAGADLALARAVSVMVEKIGLDPAAALAMATSVPADLMGLPQGRLRFGDPANLIHLSAGFTVQSLWQNGVAVEK